LTCFLPIGLIASIIFLRLFHVASSHSLPLPSPHTAADCRQQGTTFSVQEKKKVGESAEKSQNISDIFTNSIEICTNSIEIFENINDILTFFCASAEFQCSIAESPVPTL